MEAEDFERSLRAFVRRRPFESFMIRFVDGSTLTVDHPEALVLRGGLAVDVSAQGDPTRFDHRSVSQLSNPVDATAIPG